MQVLNNKRKIYSVHSDKKKPVIKVLVAPFELNWWEAERNVHGSGEL